MSVYVIDHHPLMRDALTTLLRRAHPNLDVIPLNQLNELQPAVGLHGHPILVCLDLKLPDTAGLSGLRQLATQYPDAPLAVISAVPAREMATWCEEAGASAYIEKTAEPAQILHTLRSLLNGAVDGIGNEQAVSTPLEPIRLSKRQQQLIGLLDEGFSNRDIAERLGISEHTVKVHLWRLFRRIDVKSRTQAVAWARRNGLLAL